jgi:hypothetical protein
MARCHRFATQSTGTPVYGRPQGGVNLRRGILLQPRPHGGVQVARDADAGVTPALLRDLGVAAARQPLCRMAVPQVVEATRRAGPLFVPFARVPRWVCPVRSTIAGSPAATSRALQRSAVTSARREPQSAPGRTGVNIRVGRKSANSRAVAWASRARIVVVSIFVPPTAPAGLRPRIRHVRAWLVSANACRVRRWPAPENWSSLRHGFAPWGGCHPGMDEACGRHARRQAAPGRCLVSQGRRGCPSNPDHRVDSPRTARALSPAAGRQRRCRIIR